MALTAWCCLWKLLVQCVQHRVVLCLSCNTLGWRDRQRSSSHLEGSAVICQGLFERVCIGQDPLWRGRGDASQKRLCWRWLRNLCAVCTAWKPRGGLDWVKLVCICQKNHFTPKRSSNSTCLFYQNARERLSVVGLAAFYPEKRWWRRALLPCWRVGVCPQVSSLCLLGWGFLEVCVSLKLECFWFHLKIHHTCRRWTRLPLQK